MRRGLWAPPSHRSMGANVVTDWISNNKKILIVALGVTALVIAGVWWSRRSATTTKTTTGMYAGRTGAAVSEATAPTAVPGTVTTTTVVTEQPIVTSQGAPAVQMAPVAQQQCMQTSLPVAFDVFQDNLGTANASGVVPAVSFTGGLPVDYTANESSGVNPAAVWQSSQLLPTNNCGQSLQGTDDWSLYAPSNAQVVNFLSAGYNSGQDTVMTTLKNASLDLRPEPAVSNCFQSPWNQSSWVEPSLMRTDWSHSLVA